MSKSSIRLLVVEEQAGIRSLVVRALAEDGALRARGCPLEAALAALAEFDPDAVVYGSGPSRGAESRVLREIRAKRRDLPIVLFSPRFAPGSAAVRLALSLGGCTRLPCSPARYAPDGLADLVSQSLGPWIRDVILKQRQGGSALHMDTLSEDDAGFLRGLIREHAGIVLEPGRDLLLQVRLAPLAKIHRLASVSELVKRLRTGTFGFPHREAIDAVLSTETWFFQELELFEELRKNVLPELILRRSEERELNFWSAACSTGQAIG